MSYEVKTLGNCGKELGVSDKKLEDAVKAAGVQPDAKKGTCSVYSKKKVEKVKKMIN